jgi:carboxyl-terminal processing protease
MKRILLKLILIISLFHITGCSLIPWYKKPKPDVIFEELWNSVNDNYYNLAASRVEWDKMYEIYMSLVTPETSDENLFSICCEMLQELEDDGIIFTDGDIRYCDQNQILRIEEEFTTVESLLDFWTLISATLKFYDFIELKSFMIEDQLIMKYYNSSLYGYLRIDDMNSFTYIELYEFIQDVLIDLKQRDALIIDLRFCSSSENNLARSLASFFTDKKITGCFSRSRIPGSKAYTKLETVYLESAEGLHYGGEIIVLTSDYTSGSAELFTLLMGELPHVSTVGETTEGIITDRVDIQLSNTWFLSLPNTQYFSTDMENFYGKGIRPDFFAVNNYSDIQDGIDPVIKIAIEILKGSNLEDEEL